MANFDDTDLFLVERSNTSYKATGAQVKSKYNPSRPPVIDSVSLEEDDDTGDRFTSQSFTSTTVMTDEGNEPAQLGIRVQIDGNLDGGSATRLYCVLDSNLNVTDLQVANPGFRNVTDKVNQITFPSVLPSGETPDEVCPNGSTIMTTVQASNSTQTVTEDSNSVTPSPNDPLAPFLVMEALFDSNFEATGLSNLTSKRQAGSVSIVEKAGYQCLSCGGVTNYVGYKNWTVGSGFQFFGPAEVYCSIYVYIPSTSAVPTECIQIVGQNLHTRRDAWRFFSAGTNFEPVGNLDQPFDPAGCRWAYDRWQLWEYRNVPSNNAYRIYIDGVSTALNPYPGGVNSYEWINMGAREASGTVFDEYVTAPIFVREFRAYNLSSFFSENPDSLAAYQVVKTALESYEGDRQSYRQNLRDQLVADGIPTNDIIAMGL